jgi:phosphate transport system protein
MDPADLHHHISRRYNEELDRVRTHFLAMGGLVEQQVQRALRALIEGDGSLARTIEAEELRVNDLEITIDEECSFLLAMRAPTAGDLRSVVAIVKAVTDLERVGDEGGKIGVIAARLAAAERPADRYTEVRHVGRAASDMLHDALDAFARMDAEAAVAVARRDRLVDDEFEALQRQAITFMMEDPRAIRRTLDLLWTVRSLERIGDHAKNICEHVVYMARGEDIRHGHGEGLSGTEIAEIVAPAASSLAFSASPGEPPPPAG